MLWRHLNGPVSNTRQTVHRYFCVQEAIKYRMLPVDSSAKLLTTFQCARPIDVGIFKAEPCCPPGPLDRGHQRLPFCTGPGGGDSRRRTASTASRLVARSLCTLVCARSLAPVPSPAQSCPGPVCPVQGCSNRESRESRGAKKRRFAPNREALNKIPNRPNRC